MKGSFPQQQPTGLHATESLLLHYQLSNYRSAALGAAMHAARVRTASTSIVDSTDEIGWPVSHWDPNLFADVVLPYLYLRCAHQYVPTRTTTGVVPTAKLQP